MSNDICLQGVTEGPLGQSNMLVEQVLEIRPFHFNSEHSTGPWDGEIKIRGTV